MDRGYEGYNLFAHLIEKGIVDFLCRVRSNNGGMRIVKNLPMKELDRDIQFELTTTQTKEDKEKHRVYIQGARKDGKNYSPKTLNRAWDFASPYTMNLRVVRFQLSSGEYETIITHCLDLCFPAKTSRICIICAGVSKRPFVTSNMRLA